MLGVVLLTGLLGVTSTIALVFSVMSSRHESIEGRKALETFVSKGMVEIPKRFNDILFFLLE